MKPQQKPVNDWSKATSKRKMIYAGIAAMAFVVLLMFLSTCIGPTNAPPPEESSMGILQRNVDAAFTQGNPYRQARNRAEEAEKRAAPDPQNREQMEMEEQKEENLEERNEQREDTIQTPVNPADNAR